MASWYRSCRNLRCEGVDLVLHERAVPLQKRLRSGVFSELLHHLRVGGVERQVVLLHLLGRERNAECE